GLSIVSSWLASLENTRPSVVVVAGGATVVAAGMILLGSAPAGAAKGNARAAAEVASSNLRIEGDSPLPNSTQLPAVWFLWARNMRRIPVSGYARVRGSIR